MVPRILGYHLQRIPNKSPTAINSPIHGQVKNRFVINNRKTEASTLYQNLVIDQKPNNTCERL